MSPLEGFVLDCHPDPVTNEAIIWIKHPQDGTVTPVHRPLDPTFYVASRETPHALDELQDALSQLPQLTLTPCTRRLGLDDDPSPVLKVQVGTSSAFRHLARSVDAYGDHRTFDLYDVDLRLSHQALLQEGLFPFAWVDLAGDEITLTDEQWALDYDPPPLEAATLTGTLDTPPGRVPRYEDPLEQVTLQTSTDERILDGPEARILEDLNDALDQTDPDVLFTEDGDRFLVRYLHHRAATHNVPLQLGRSKDPDAPLRGERSYFTYGQIKYQPRVEVLHGRLHIDTQDSFFYEEAGAWGLIDLSRITSTPLQELARVGAGTAVTAIQIDRAKREGRLVPWKKNRPEDVKTEHTLVKADRGGFIFDPRVGLFEDVVELDFASMYPNIMVTRNVSPETILCSCCDPDDEDVLRVPQIGYHTCKDDGFIGRALEPLIERRSTFKRLRHERPDERGRFQAAVDALKWLAVCSFGYQGYKNARFGRIECHEAICAWGREILLTCAEIAREEGFEIVHGIVDSVWLKRTEPWADEERLAQRVTDALEIPLELEGCYDWIVFLPTRSYARDDVEAAGALNRFYGCFTAPPDAPSRSQAGQEVDYIEDGRVKVRGVELRQRSCPPIVQTVQEEVLRELAEATTADGFQARIPAALDRVDPILERVRHGDVEARDLVITKRVSKPVDAYKARTDTWAALSQLEEAGVEVPPGDSVRFVVLDDDATEPCKRVAEVRITDVIEAYDAAYYEGEILHALESLLLPLGWDASKLGRFFSRATEPTLWSF